MLRSGLAVVVMLQVVTAALGQGPAFVPQLSDGQSSAVPQAGSSSGAFVMQLPGEARPRQLSAPAAAPPALAERKFIQPAERQSPEQPLIVEEDQAVVPFNKENRPSLPTLTQGVAVSLTTGAETLPNVGAGAVVL